MDNLLTYVWGTLSEGVVIAFDDLPKEMSIRFPTEFVIIVLESGEVSFRLISGYTDCNSASVTSPSLELSY